MCDPFRHLIKYLFSLFPVPILRIVKPPPSQWAHSELLSLASTPRMNLSKPASQCCWGISLPIWALIPWPPFPLPWAQSQVCVRTQQDHSCSVDIPERPPLNSWRCFLFGTVFLSQLDRRQCLIWASAMLWCLTESPTSRFVHRCLLQIWGPKMGGEKPMNQGAP